MHLFYCYSQFQLSPALRNRFTEIWCSPSDSYDDLKKIIEHNIKHGLSLKAFASCQSKKIQFLLFVYVIEIVSQH